MPESNSGHGGENAGSLPLDHMGILGFVEIQFPSMKPDLLLLQK